jgi:DNA mismatch repair protein MutS2
MQSTVLRTLEFDRIREALALEALTPLGRDRADRLVPSDDAAVVQGHLELTSEAVAFVRSGGSLAITAPDDLSLIFELLRVDQQPLEPLHLLALARFVESVEQVASGIGSGIGDADSSQTRPLLSRIARRVTTFEAEIRAVRRAIHSSGDVNDDASAALKDLREKLRRQRARLRSTLDGLVRGRDTSKYLQDQIVTDRNGRYVLILRAEHRDSIPGIVHGASASGASLYVEPLSTVELNNEVVSLAEREREEVHRILLALTDAFRRREDEFAAVVDVAADLDELYAKVQLAHRMEGLAPALTTDGRLEFRGARHPLLIPAIRDRLDDPTGGPAVVVGTDLLVTPPTRALVISGPNTGGKTVALKAVGLLALMAQAGLFIPVDAGSQFTPFCSVFADIGDEQSIAASLSTFSAHIANIVAMDRALSLPALVLLDEVGGGTDPAEGGALGIAVIDHFRQRGALIIATTHDDALKSYAATTEGVGTAAFGFNPETYAPTYKLIYGAPGRSLALEIAERLGLPAPVIAAARAKRSTRETQLAEHLARIDRELASLDADRRRVEDERRAVAAERDALLARESKVTEREAVLRRRMDEKLNDRLREARQEVDRIVADLKGKAGSLVRHADARASAHLSTGEIGGLRTEARTALESVAAQLDDDHTPRGEVDDVLTSAPEIGQSVFVVPFGAEAIVRGVAGKHVDVEVRGKRMRVGVKELRRVSAGSAGRSGAGGHQPSKSSAFAPPRLPGAAPAALASRDLVLIGSTVDEAVDRAEKFLDQALLADERRVRVVHGHGTGRLRDALRKYFREHPLVASATPAADNEGGDAATIVELKD